MKKKRVTEYFGGVGKTALVLGISHPAVCRWGDVIPEKQALKVERITNGELRYDPVFYSRNHKQPDQK
ncbi:Cro/CI family transcriptional regulator [Hafnia alvei]|uniref:Cro/CI family transcriptional regulator n=1 Tax=Hafnia alvei TaxID=569 RepID=UPI000E086C65|nr:Cro/CI family transcriptional regulator [Hafnia alvei]STR05760.1 DNA-binding transcriptional regulator DicC [Hafnia alvei]